MTLRTIRAFVLDVDGVLTDGGVWRGLAEASGNASILQTSREVSLARKPELLLPLISGKDSSLYRDLRPSRISTGSRTRPVCRLRGAWETFDVPLRQIACVGGDVNDTWAISVLSTGQRPTPG
jgi:3-deoxy-D-manno-octulosonate 8-phosphate phosphatase KdsC-like HAD superfamily phosphatase